LIVAAANLVVNNLLHEGPEVLTPIQEGGGP
jgi:hypothetical protein